MDGNQNARGYLIKVASSSRPVSPASYKKMRKAALYSSGIGTKERLRLLRKSLEGRGKDKVPSTRYGRLGMLAGGALGTGAGVAALRLPIGGPMSLKAILGALAATTGGGAVIGRSLGRYLPEKKRRFASKAAKNPDALKAILQSRRRTGIFGRNRMRQEADLMREFASARKGKKPGGALISIEKG